MSDMPKDPSNFKRWADAECPKWPPLLMVEAYHAADAWQYQQSDVKIRKFAESYEAWRQTLVDAEHR
jgi:hypothetical protein